MMASKVCILLLFLHVLVLIVHANSGGHSAVDITSDGNRRYLKEGGKKQKKKQGTQFEKLPFPVGTCPPGMRRRINTMYSSTSATATAATTSGEGENQVDAAAAALLLLNCVGITTSEVNNAMHWLAFPNQSLNQNQKTRTRTSTTASSFSTTTMSSSSSSSCQKHFNVQGFSICEDSMEFATASESAVASARERQVLNNVAGDAFPDFVDNTLSNPSCTVWSIIATQFCDDLGSLEYEREMARRGCTVELFHYSLYMDGQLCKPSEGKHTQITEDFWGKGFYNRIHVHRIVVWEKRCYACLYKKVLELLAAHDSRQKSTNQKQKQKRYLVDVLKIQSRYYVEAHPYPADKSKEDKKKKDKDKDREKQPTGYDLHADVYDGIQYVILSDLFLYTPDFLRLHVGQLHVNLPFTTYSLTDGLGREAENGYNMWAAAHMLMGSFLLLNSERRSLYENAGKSFANADLPPHSMAPVLFTQQLSAQVGLNATWQHFFLQSFININNNNADKVQSNAVVVGKGGEVSNSEEEQQNSKLPSFSLPEYCVVPNSKSMPATILIEEARVFIAASSTARCHPERLWLPCDHSRTYAPLLPCPEQLYDSIAYNYAVSKGWCSFKSPLSRIEPLQTVRGVLREDLAAEDLAAEAAAYVAAVASGSSKAIIPTINFQTAKMRAPRLRLVFFFTIYSEEDHVLRILGRLYSPHHFYVLHVDPRGSEPGFADKLSALVRERILGGLGDWTEILEENEENTNDNNKKKKKKATILGNVAIANDVSIVYGAATATILLSRAMAWCLDSDQLIANGIEQTLKVALQQPDRKPRQTSAWDYFVPLTGSDYPLVSLQMLEEILSSSYSTDLIAEEGSSQLKEAGYQPFVMGWDRGVSDHIIALQAQYPKMYKDDNEVRESLEITWTERGDKRMIGSNLMETRAFSYGPPLQCNKAFTYHRLDTRTMRNNTQWLFPRAGAITNGKARVATNDAKMSSSLTVDAAADEKEAYDRVRLYHLATDGSGQTVPDIAIHQSTAAKRNNDRKHVSDFNTIGSVSYSNIDAVHRTWRKSDPATTGAFDRRSVEALIQTEEGRKYYHFFKDMLLGSEEHYYITFLYNNPRTKKFVTSLSAQSVWNTWKFGSWEAAMGGFKTHTHFLLKKNMPLLKGLSKRGVLFGRKMSQKKTPEIIDQLDQFIDDENSLAGKYWPGFYPVSEKENEKEKEARSN